MASHLSATHQELSRQLAWTRREFLRTGAAMALGSTVLHNPVALAGVPTKKRKVVVITFGGGARDQETFAPEGQENIPHMMKELIPQSTFFTQVVNRGILGHYVANASLATGVYERFDNFADVAPVNPTVFEYFRKGLGRPANDTWVIAPSNGFNRIGQSDGPRFAPGLGAKVILPKHLLASALGKTSTSSAGLDFLLQDNYEDPLYTPPAVQSNVQLSRLTEMLHLSVDDFTHHAKTLSSAAGVFGY